MLSDVLQSVVTLSIVVLSVVLQSVFTLSVVMLNVVRSESQGAK